MTYAESIHLLEEQPSVSQYFFEELALIKDISLRHSLIYFLDEFIGLHQLERATSSSGKYHSKIQNQYGGNGWHTKMAVKVAETLSRDYPLVDFDIVYAALILHDLNKYESIDHKHTSNKHHELMYKLLKSNLKNISNSRRVLKKLKKICKAVLNHNGRWTWGNKGIYQIRWMLQPTVNKIVHTCDMVAAAKWLEI